MKRFAFVTCLAACLVFALGSAFAANTVTVGSAAVGVGGNTTVGVSFSNDTQLNGLVCPLVWKAGTNSAYPASVTATYNPAGRLPETAGQPLSGLMLKNAYDLADGSCAGLAFATLYSGGNNGVLDSPSSPDLILFVRNSVFPATPLAPGTDAVPSILLAMNVGGTVGDYIIDTACADPANHLLFVQSVGGGAIPAFTPGVITVTPNACPDNVAAASDPVGATVGAQASNQITATDPTIPPDPISYFLVSGPGAVDVSSGMWTWTPSCGDVAGSPYTVEVEATDKGEGSCAGSHVSFTVNVTPTALQISCSNVTVGWAGADAAQTIGVSGGCPPYSYSASAGAIDGSGNWSYNQDCGDVGTAAVVIDVTDDAGQQISCTFNLNVTNTAPTCSAPADLTAPTGVPFDVLLGPASQGDGDALTYNLVSGPAWVSIAGNHLVGTRPVGENNPETACFEVTDGCATSSQCCFNILFESPFYVCFDDGDAGNGQSEYIHTFGGQNATICVWVDPSTGSSAGVGGFDFLICYDQSGLTFQNAYRGPDMAAGWEYFTWRTGMFGGNCGGGCPDGFVRLVGIADMNNGITPSPSTFALAGSVVCLDFFVTGDQEFTGSCLHVGFCSYDCGDNVISSKDGTKLFLPNSGVSYGVDYDIEFCLEGKPGYEAEPFIDFCQGAICIDEPPDDRGDINVNGIPNEIGDAVLYSQYFISGISAFSSDAGIRAVQIFASDVNNDGLTLTVADLIYLIRIITGDEQPFPDDNINPKVSPYANQVTVISDVQNGALTVHTNSAVELGGALLVYRYSGVEIGNATVTAGEGLNVKTNASNGELRVLVYPDMNTGGKAQAGSNDLLSINVEGEGTIELTESQFADANGAVLSVTAAAKIVPQSYALHQNFPNPFNAGTVIPVTLKDASDWSLTIYNVAGQVVKNFSGRDEAGTINVQWDGTGTDGGTVASGMYFYRLNANDYTATKKMLLLK